MDFAFTGRVIEWRGPAPFYFIETPAKYTDEIKAIAADKSYGWGVVHCMISIRSYTFKTALFPKQGHYLIPLKIAVSTALGIELGNTVKVELDFDCS